MKQLSGRMKRRVGLIQALLNELEFYIYMTHRNAEL